MVTQYAREKNAWDDFDKCVVDLITRFGYRRVSDVGGGAKPSIEPLVVQQMALDYVVIDPSASEMEKAPGDHRRVVGDACDPGVIPPSDLVISRVTAEHMLDPARFHRAVRAALPPGGHAAHFFPTLYAPAFVLNRLLPEKLSSAILHWIQPYRTEGGNYDKFRAYYRWCRGPTSRQVRRLESCGFTIESYTGYFGYAGYYQRVPPMRVAHERLSDFLVDHPVPALTSFARVVLRAI